MVPSVPRPPDPAVPGPLTGGQKVAHEPVHFEAVGVSGTNQYRVMPAELVSTCVPLMLVALTVEPPAAGAVADPAALLAGVAGVFPEAAELLPELEQAEAVRAKAARPATPRILRMWISPIQMCDGLPLGVRTRGLMGSVEYSRDR